MLVFMHLRRVTLFNTNDTKLVEELCGDLTDMLVTILTVLAEAENGTAPSANSTSCTAIHPAGGPVYALEVDVSATVAVRFLTTVSPNCHARMAGLHTRWVTHMQCA